MNDNKPLSKDPDALDVSPEPLATFHAVETMQSATLEISKNYYKHARYLVDGTEVGYVEHTIGLEPIFMIYAYQGVNLDDFLEWSAEVDALREALDKRRQVHNRWVILS